MPPFGEIARQVGQLVPDEKGRRHVIQHCCDPVDELIGRVRRRHDRCRDTGDLRGVCPRTPVCRPINQLLQVQRSNGLIAVPESLVTTNVVGQEHHLLLCAQLGDGHETAVDERCGIGDAGQRLRTNRTEEAGEVQVAAQTIIDDLGG